MSLRVVTGPQGAPLEPLQGRTVAVLGFGNQGAAHAMNLRDSGIDVVVGNRPGSAGGRRAVENGFAPVSLEEAAASSDLVVVALPDEVQAAVWRERLAPHVRAGATVGFLHGFNVHYRLIRAPAEVGVIMVAPKGPGRTLRDRFVRGEGIPCLFAVHQEPAPAGAGPSAEAIGLAWAHGIGCARAAIVHTTFAHETETDLFGEQTVLCGGLSELMVAAYEVLVEAGYPPELAYMECCQEVKQVTDLMYERGLAAMMDAISNTAEFGAYRTGPVVVDEAVRARMRNVLAEVRDGSFAAALRYDHDRGFAWFEAERRKRREHALEEAGAAVRRWFPWLSDGSRS